MNEGAMQESIRLKNVSEPLSYTSDEESFVVLDRSPNHEPPSGEHYTMNPALCSPNPNGIPSDIQNANPSLTIYSVELSPEEIQKRLDEVLQENIELKETLLQNNLAMKQQLTTLRAWQEEVLKSHQNHKDKFAEMKELIIKLKAENEALKSSLSTEESVRASESSLLAANTKLTGEVETLRLQVEALNARNEHVGSKKEQELIALTEQLNRKLETAERSRRQLTVDIERVQAQKVRLERDVVILKVELESQKQHTEAVEKAYEKRPLDAEVEALKVQLAAQQDVIEKLASEQEQQQQHVVQQQSNASWMNIAPSNSLAEKLQQEIQEAKQMLQAEQARGMEKEAQLSAAQEQLQRLSCGTMDQHSATYHEVQLRGFTEKLDNMTAQILNLQDALHQKDKRVEEAELRMRQLEQDNESIPILQIQMQVYQADFNAEREARESLAGEKERLAEDLRRLQRRNQQLLSELKLQSCVDQPQQPNSMNGGWNTISTPGRNHARENTPPDQNDF